jgi:peptidoglycan/xylan/chitin deacetylase (PgdA/CDA1 family)
MTALHELGTKVVPLEQIRTSPGAVAITFDDGFRNFYEHALPALQERGFPATVFVVTGFCGGNNDWPSQPDKPPVPVLPLMTWSELREISAAGISLGSHTVTHPRLAALSEEHIEEELRTSQTQLEDRSGARATTFAYPYGESTPRVQDAARRHYRIACGTKLAHVSSDSDAADLARLDAYYFRNLTWFRRIGNQSGEAYISARRWLRELRSSLSKH